MTLERWVRILGGPKEAAFILKVTPHTVRSWLRSESCPRPRVMQEIWRLSRGKVSFETIIGETSRKSK